MSKARITYRFESARRAAGQAASEGQASETNVHRVIQSKTANEAEERDTRSNVIPLRHDEFRLSDDTIVLEERHLPEPVPEPKKSADVKDRSGLQSYPYDYAAWNGSTAEEIDRLEQLIRATDEEPEARRTEYETFRNDRGTKLEDETYRETGYPRPRSERQSKTVLEQTPDDKASWWKMGVSIVGAVATGVLFGSFLLSMFTSDAGDNTSMDAIQGEQSAPISELGEHTAEGKEAAPASAESVSDYSALNIPARDLYLLQNGKFSTLENARTLAEQLKEKGLAATIEESGSFWVYAGVTSDRDAALRVSRQLQQDGVDVFIKKYNLPEVKQVRWAGEQPAETLGAYVNQGSKMVQMIGDLTLVHLEGTERTAPEKTTMEKLSAEHRAFTEASADAMSGLPAEAQPMLKRMDAAVTTAVVAVQEYAANPDAAYLWSAQSALMDYVIAEKELLTTIAIN